MYLSVVDPNDKLHKAQTSHSNSQQLAWNATQFNIAVGGSPEIVRTLILQDETQAAQIQI